MSATSSIGEDGVAPSPQLSSKASSCADDTSGAKKFGAVVFEEVFDENSQPTHDEILEYATKIGIDVVNEPHLLDIAKEGILAQLPPHWKPCWDETINDFYYFNIETGETQWCHPLDDLFKQKVIIARQGGPVPDSKTTENQVANDVSCEDASDIPDERDLSDGQRQETDQDMAHPKPSKLAPLQPIGKGPNPSLMKSLPPLKGNGKPAKESLSELTAKQKSFSISSEQSPSPSPKRMIQASQITEKPTTNQSSAKQKSLHLKLSGSSFLKSSDEKDDSETSKRSQELSPRKSILKTSLSPNKSSSGSRANLMAKDEKKIQFDLNENLAFEMESDKSSSENSSKIISSRDIKRASSNLLQSNARKNLLESSSLVMDPEDLLPTKPKPLEDPSSVPDHSKNPEASPILAPAPASRLSKILSKSQSTDSVKSNDDSTSSKSLNVARKSLDVKQPIQPDIPIVVSKPAKGSSQKMTYGGSDDSSISDSSSSHVDQLHTKKSARNLSKTLGYLSATEPAKVVPDQPPDSVEDSSARPDDVLQTVKFGEDVLQQMRAKRNEILTSHGISQKPPEPKVVKLSTQEKIIIPSSKVSDQMASRQKDYEDQLSKVASEFDDKLCALHSDMTEMMMTQKAELEAKMREIVSAETGQLRKEFRMERDLQETKLRSLVSEEMTSLRKSLDSDFEKQRKSLLEALNEQMTKSLNQVDRQQRVDSQKKSSQDFSAELEDFRKYLDQELKRQMSDNISELKDELTMTFKEQEKELLKLMFKAKTGNDAPAGTNRPRPYQSDFAKELEGIEDDLKQLRTMVVGASGEKSPSKNAHFSTSTVDSDTSEDFIDPGRSKNHHHHHRRPRHHHRSRQHHSSAYNLNSDADSMYDSSSGDVNVSLQTLQDRVNFLERSLAPFAVPMSKSFGPSQQDNQFQMKNSQQRNFDGFYDPAGMTMGQATFGNPYSTPQTVLNVTNFLKPSHSVWTVEDQIFKSKMWLKQRNQIALPRP